MSPDRGGDDHDQDKPGAGPLDWGRTRGVKTSPGKTVEEVPTITEEWCRPCSGYLSAVWRLLLSAVSR